MSKKVDKSIKNAISNEESKEKTSEFSEKDRLMLYYQNFPDLVEVDKDTKKPIKINEKALNVLRATILLTYSIVDNASLIQTRFIKNQKQELSFPYSKGFTDFQHLWNDKTKIEEAINLTGFRFYGYISTPERKNWYEDPNTILELPKLCKSLSENSPLQDNISFKNTFQSVFNKSNLEEKHNEGLRWYLTLNGMKVLVHLEFVKPPFIECSQNSVFDEKILKFLPTSNILYENQQYLISIGFCDYEDGFTMVRYGDEGENIFQWFATWLAYTPNVENQKTLKTLFDEINHIRQMKDDLDMFEEFCALQAKYMKRFQEYFNTIETARNAPTARKEQILTKLLGERTVLKVADLSPVLLDLSAISEEKPISKKRKRELEVMEKEVLTETPSKKKAPETPPLRRSARLCECGKTTPCKEPVLQSSKIKALGASSAEKAYKQSLKSYFQKHPEAKKRNNELNKPLPKNKKAKKN